jgi:hypothetical protein
MIRLTAQTALVCLFVLAAGGCAVELPKSAFGGFRLGPVDGAGQSDVGEPKRQAPKPIAD